jgi:acyl carrier protein
MILNQILSDIFGMTPEQNSDETSILSMPNFDSMNHMIFITQLEEKFNIELTGDEITDMLTIGDIKRVLIQKGISF